MNCEFLLKRPSKFTSVNAVKQNKIALKKHKGLIPHYSFSFFLFSISFLRLLSFHENNTKTNIGVLFR